MNFRLYKNKASVLLTSLVSFQSSRVDASSIRARLARGAFWSLSGSLISRGLTLFASILTARFLGSAGYGELGIVQSTVGMFGVFAGFGMGVTSTKHVAEFRDSAPERAGRIIALSSLIAVITGLLMSLLLLVLAPWLASATLSAPGLAPLLQLSSILLLLSAINGAQTGALAGFEAFRAIALVNLLVGLLSFPFVVAGAYWRGINGTIVGLVASMMVNCLANFIALRKVAGRACVPLGYKDCLKEWKVLWSFSLPALLSSIMWGPVNWVCSAMLVNQPNGLTEMGIFNAANQWRTAILYLPSTLGAIVLPLLANLKEEADQPKYAKVLAYNVALSGGFTLLAAIFVALSAKFIMNCYGSGFATGYGVLTVISFSTVFIAINNVVGQAIASRNKMWIGFAFNFLWAVVLIATSYLFVAKYGALAIGVATIIAYLFHTAWQSMYVKSLLKVS